MSFDHLIARTVPVIALAIAAAGTVLVSAPIVIRPSA